MMKSTTSASFTVTWWASIPSQHQRVERHPPGVCSLRPAVCIRVSSLRQILGPIRLELTESCCCCWASRPPSPSLWAASPSKHQRFERQPPGVRSTWSAVCTHFVSPSSNSGSNPTGIDREPPCCCCWASWLRSPSRWITSPANDQRVERQILGVRSAWPDVCIRVRSLSQTLGQIRPVLTEIRHYTVTVSVRRRPAALSSRTGPSC